MKIGLFTFIAIIAASALFGAMGAIYYLDSNSKTENKLIADFYEAEHAVSISPSDFAHYLDIGIIPGQLVDLRAKGAYESGHMITAINIPAGEMGSDEVLAAFSKLPLDKPVIVYCYSSYCMLSKNVGNFLAQKGIFVKHLTAGWYEINRDFSTYIVKGPLPGTPTNIANGTNGLCPPNQIGSFGC
jgi:rhodanese-related sulfurtransferase